MTTRTPTSTRVGGLTLSNVSSATPNPMQQLTGGGSCHPVEVVGRIREHPEGRDEPSAIHVLPNGRDLRIRLADQLQYRDFSLDGVSRAEDECLEAFYRKYAEARIEDVKGGGKCTIMMYGPTGAGKSHTMFGSHRERGVAYHALRQIMGDGGDNSCSREVKLVMRGHKVVNSTTQEDTDANRLVKEIQKVEKRRVTKTTNCNDRSSRSHCVVTLEVPAVGGRLVLVDMAGSENIEQAGVGIDARLQTGKINQGNGALKRVVEAIAAQSDHIPYRDSKLTMLLQDSFETVNAKILMILCASPCPKDLYKTLGTLEYGAKAKTIVRLPNSPAKEKVLEADIKMLATMQARIAQKDMSLEKLRREKEKSDKEKAAKEKEVKDLMRRVEDIENELRRNQTFAREFQDTKSKLDELEKQLDQKQRELDFQRSRAEKAEAELCELKESLKSDAKDVGSAGRALRSVTVESPLIRRENLKDISNGLSDETTVDSTPKSENGKFTTPPVSRKFSPSVLSFLWNNSDSQEPFLSSKKAADVTPTEGVSKNKESPSKPKSSGDRKRKEQALTLRDLLNRSEEEQVSKTLKSSQQVAVRDSSYGGGPHSWSSTSNFASNVAPASDVQDETDNMSCDNSHVERQEEEETLLQAEKDPLGLGTWSETRLHRRGWLPIIHEEQEDDAEEMSVSRPFSSCPRLTQGQSVLDRFMARSTAESEATTTTQNWFQDKFSALSESQEENSKPRAFEKRLEAAGVQLIDHTKEETDSPMEESTKKSEVEMLIGRLASGHREAEASGREEPESTDVQSVRKARIENIFMFCGHGREVKSRTNFEEVCTPQSTWSRGSPTSTPEHHTPASNVARELNLRPESVSPFSSPHSRPLSAVSSPLSSFRDNQSHLCLEADGFYSPARPSGHRVTKSFDEGLLSQENFNSYLASPFPVLPSPQKSDSPARHRKFRNCSLFPQRVPSYEAELLSDDKVGVQEASVTISRETTPASPGRSVSHGNEDTQENTVPAGSLPVDDNCYPSNGDENVPVNNSKDLPTCDVYVKWESSGKESSGKSICVLKMAQGSTLAELRREIHTHLATPTKQGYNFLMLGDLGGAPVERDLESDLRVSSLPVGPSSQNSFVASLRPPQTMQPVPTKPTTPFRSIENQLNTPTTPNSKLAAKVGPLGGPNSCGKPGSGSGSSSMSLVKGLRTLANGVGIRSGSTVR